MKASTTFLLSFLSVLSPVWANADTDGTDADVSSIQVIGNKFFYSNGSQFYIKGIAYQQDTSNAMSGYEAGLGQTTFIDPLANSDACKRDLPYLLDLKTNVVRVYAINTTLSHKGCMDLFAKNGIYVIADLSQPSQSINRVSPEWNVGLYQRYTDVIDSLSNYTNVLGFFAGNEVTNNVTNTDASPFVKAAVRDAKAYIKDQGYRNIPVGYSSNDDSTTRIAMANYFACGNEDEKVDFYGINMYSWCGDSSFQASGYDQRTKEFSNLTVPVFLSEYGCNEVQPRKFSDIPTLFSSQMTDVWSGGIIYMYFQEANNYGLVTVEGQAVKTLNDYNNLKSQMAKATPTSATANSATSTLSCPATGSTWLAASSLPPTPKESVCDCLEASLSCVISSSVDTKDYGDLYATICGLIDCSAISINGTTGKYGAFSYCKEDTKLSFILNEYYEINGKKSGDCDFSGSASLISPSGVSSCSSIISSASANPSATGTGSSSGGSGSSSKSSSGSKSSKSGTVSVRPVDAFTMVSLLVISTFFFGGLGFALF